VIRGVCDCVDIIILYGSGSVCIDPEVKGQGHTVPRTVEVAWLLVLLLRSSAALLMPAWDCTSYDCFDWRYVALVVILWSPALSSSLSVTALR